MRMMKTIAATLALSVGALTVAGSADARHRRHHVVHHHHHDGGNFAAGAIGFGIGALVGSALSAPRYYEPAPVYVAPAPVYAAPVVVYEAWTPGWYTYCGQRYRSFNRQTGYYLGYDGGYHFCR